VNANGRPGMGGTSRATTPIPTGPDVAKPAQLRRRSRLGREAAPAGQLVDVASQFYLQGRTQLEIARSMGLDPSTVSRSLKRAREAGIVRIEIRPRALEETGLGLALAHMYGLARAIIVPGDEPSAEEVASVGADHIAGLLRSGMRLGVSWGQTLASLVHCLPARIVSDLEVAQMAGGISTTTPGAQGNELVRYLAELYPPSRVHYLHAPAIVDSVEIQRAIVSDRSVHAALAAASACDLALVGIGTLGDDATVVRGGHLSADDRMLLLEHGAVGNMNTRFFDSAGRPVADLEERTVAVQWEELRRVPTVVAVAAGLAKARAIRGALQTGCVDVLVTDASTARLLVGVAAAAG
jgi:DNA-binding transcriptional regulator LsrR (DeoR family)